MNANVTAYPPPVFRTGCKLFNLYRPDGKKKLFREIINEGVTLSNKFPYMKGMIGVFQYGDCIAKNSAILAQNIGIKENSVDHNFRDHEFNKVCKLPMEEAINLPLPKKWRIVHDDMAEGGREPVTISTIEEDHLESPEIENGADSQEPLEFNLISEDDQTQINEIDDQEDIFDFENNDNFWFEQSYI